MFVGQVFDRGLWITVVTSSDKEYIAHCLLYKKYESYETRIVSEWE